MYQTVLVTGASCLQAVGGFRFSKGVPGHQGPPHQADCDEGQGDSPIAAFDSICGGQSFQREWSDFVEG
jgi:hypothetical protein